MSPSGERYTNRSKSQTNGKKAIWVSKLYRDTTEEEMLQYIKDLVGIAASEQCQVRKLVSKDKLISTYSFVSFRIICPENTFSTLLDANKWPSQCQIREFEMERRSSTGYMLNKTTATTRQVPTVNVSKNVETSGTVELPKTPMEMFTPTSMDSSQVIH